MKVIIISGTPGTGKSSLAKLIEKKTNFKTLDFKKILKENKLNETYDAKRKCYVVNIKKLNKILVQIIKNFKNNLIIDSHLGHFFPKKYANLCIITKCNLRELKKRLIKRKYNKLKIKENLECEIFNVCLTESQKLGHNILIIDTTKGVKDLNIKKIISLCN